MGRIQRAYELRFRTVLSWLNARQPQRGVAWLLRRASEISAREGKSPSDGLTRVFNELVNRTGYVRRAAPVRPERFFCDSGLGGLARWLRGAGYEALWVEGIEDDELIVQAREAGAILLTTDGLLVERLPGKHGVEALWMPPTLSLRDQLAAVFREFGLECRPSRCMSCGGELRRVDKETLKHRIPPRTYRWRDEYFVCSRCDKLYWHGTHWERIQRELSQIAEKSGANASTPIDQADDGRR